RLPGLNLTRATVALPSGPAGSAVRELSGPRAAGAEARARFAGEAGCAGALGLGRCARARCAHLGETEDFGAREADVARSVGVSEEAAAPLEGRARCVGALGAPHVGVVRHAAGSGFDLPAPGLPGARSRCSAGRSRSAASPAASRVACFDRTA